MRRLGFVDLFVVLVAVYAVYTRTPVGGLGQWGVAWLRGDDGEQPTLLGFFRSEGPKKAWLDEPIAALPPETADYGDGFPEPYRSALRYALPDDLPAHTVELLGPGDDPAADRLLVWLDENWDGDAAGALEVAAIGPELRERAIERARAAGEPDPEHFESHRRYLPEDVELHAASLVDSVLSLATVFDLHWPVDPTVRISSPFGYRVHPVTKTRKFHNGVDLPVPVGTTLRAAQSGRIVAATEDSVSGKYVILEHAGGIRTAYCHLSALPEKSAGDRVSKGEVIGLSGNTGRSTGPHLHFVLRVDGEPIDPAPYRRVPKS
ncbi:MAG: M23 family metallopeptidase [Alphaproteobacteria bacterium]|nr:M23 family metallopeptidase [Alphaproteobacteria bacterium]